MQDSIVRPGGETQAQPPPSLAPNPAGPLSFHTASALFPAMTGKQYDALKADVEKHGQRVPIVLLDGQILDGRNRYRVCLELGLKPKTLEISGVDPAVAVRSLNLIRRHLTREQQAAIASDLRRRGATQAEVAKVLGVDQKTVSRTLAKETVKANALTAVKSDTPAPAEPVAEAPKAVPAAPELGQQRVLGRDGKTYPLTRKPRGKKQLSVDPGSVRAPGQIFTHEEKLCTELIGVVARICALAKKQALPERMILTVRVARRNLGDAIRDDGK